jgi:hypothetical protein
MSAGPEPEIKLIYILGFARSGTTVLGNLLGEVEGFVHVGELCRLWRRAAFARDRCGCEKKMVDCPLWSRVIPDAFARLEGRGKRALPLEECVAEGWRRQQEADKSTTVLGLVGGKEASPELRSYADLMSGVLREIAQASGTRVIVDSSKLIKPSAYVNHMDGVHPYFIHLVRDSRGSVLSRQRKKAPRRGEVAVLRTRTTAADCFRWSRINAIASLLGRNGVPRLALHYEDFVSDPSGTLGTILKWIGEPTRALPVGEDGTAKFGVNHTVSGNRNRFRTGEIRFVLDDGWKHTLRLRDYLLITGLTAPILFRYRYRMTRSNAGSNPLTAAARPG